MISDFIEERLDLMLAHPKNWGTAEAYELQVLLLLELRLYVDSSYESINSLRIIQDQYSEFLTSGFPNLGPRPLSAITEDTATIARSLDAFRQSISVTCHNFAHAEPEPTSPMAPQELGSDVDVKSGSIATMPREQKAA